MWGCFGDMQVVYVEGLEVGNGVLFCLGSLISGGSMLCYHTLTFSFMYWHQ